MAKKIVLQILKWQKLYSCNGLDSSLMYCGIYIVLRIFCHYILQRWYVYTYVIYILIQYKSPTTKQSMRVVFVSHECVFRGVGCCLVTHACGYTYEILHTYLPTHTKCLATRASECFLC